MEYEKIYNEYKKIKDNMLERKEAIIVRNLEKINKLNEERIEITEKLKTYDLKDNNFTSEEKQNLKDLVSEIKKLEENNEILINHSLGVIKNTLSGILNRIQKDKNSYNSKGLNCQNEDESPISSIIEEA